MPDTVRQYLQSATILEDYVPEVGVEVPDPLPWPGGVKEEAMTYMNAHWREVLAHLDETATNVPQQCAVIRACEGLSSEEYVSFLREVRDLYIAKKLYPRALETALFPGLYKWNFLETHSRDPEVRRFIESLRGIMPHNRDSNVDLSWYPDCLLSGTVMRYMKDIWRIASAKQRCVILAEATVAIAVLASIPLGLFFWWRRRVSVP
jgi:hypothetical protein